MGKAVQSLPWMFDTWRLHVAQRPRALCSPPARPCSPTGLILAGWSLGALVVSTVLCHLEKLGLTPLAAILLDPRSPGPLSPVSRSLGCLFASNELPGFRSTVLSVDYFAPRAGAGSAGESHSIRLMAPNSDVAKQRSLLYAHLEQLPLDVAWHI